MSYCNFDIHIMGKSPEIKLLYDTMPIADSKELTCEKQVDDNLIIQFTGDCKHSIDKFRTIEWDGSPYSIDEHANVILNNGTQNCLAEYSWLSISKMFDCEIEAHSWNPEEGWEALDVYKKGDAILNDTGLWLEYLCWDKEEYESYEDFCEVNDIDSSTILETDWEPEDPDEEDCLYFYLRESKFGTIEFEFSF